MKKAIPFFLLVVLFGGAAWYSFMKEPEEVHEVPPPPSMPPAVAVTEQQPEPAPLEEEVQVYVEPEPEVIPDPLPLLNESDPQVTGALAELAGAEALAEYLIQSEAISRLVVTLDSLTSRQVPPQINPVRPVDEKLIVETEGERMFMSTQNFSRYDGYVELIENTDTDGLMAFYQRYSPLFQQAWEENGGEGSFKQRLVGVIDELLETPDVPGPIYLTKPEAVYLFEDPELESMNAGQKILVRMGSANASVVKEKLAAIRAALQSS